MTLTREQIEDRKALLESYLHKILISKDEDPNGILEDISLCNMALNSIPKAFDVEDETTWPEPGTYLARHSNSKGWVEAIFSIWGPYDIKECGFAKWGGNGIGTPDYWMPIPEVGESK